MGQLNIKDEALIAEAKALAEMLGTSTTGALREAVRDRLARARAEKQADRKALAAELMAIGARAAARIPPHLRTSDHSDLYDENGLPV
ncbi:type II toxin-antitoxin system VapB family antitoxin [Falsiroseomonas ponticola]|jgi:hypothetical protein|uniref:type II toxin-antitoxin system VapB family antitoxin n=1 Tax=Falsiroseomonas ponticola TaxID=2786951 RepID=UPI0019338D84|nr:type II toxin-antitoxin system VapB family antitoxin [Roseomonas ponticola]